MSETLTEAFSPVQSRFVSSDPMGMVDGPNMYVYARNNPVNARDPSGCMSVPQNLVNGGGGGSVGDTCPGEQWYNSWDECRLYHDYDTCADLCFGDYEETVFFDTDEFADCLKRKYPSWTRNNAICVGLGLAGSAVFCWLSGPGYFGCLKGMIIYVVWQCTSGWASTQLAWDITQCTLHGIET